MSTVYRVVRWLTDVIGHVIQWFSHLTGLSVAIFAAVVAAVAAITGVVALVYAILSNRKSNTANEIASEATNLAKAADQRAQRQEARETERHDVHWDCGWDWGHPGRYMLMKRGADEACDIRVKMTYTSKTRAEEQTASTPSMTVDNETLTIDFAKALLDYNDERDFRVERAKHPGLAGAYEAMDRVDTRWARTVEVRVHWQTPLGAPRTYEKTFAALFSGYFRR